MQPETKNCQDCKNDFLVTSEEVLMYEKIGLKVPKKCFECRIKQCFAFWVFGKFRKGISDLSGESFITVLPNNPRYPIYKSHEWYGDDWDPMSYGMDYDPGRSFFDQLKELQEKIPRPHQVGENNTNCDWCDDSWESKNCYLSRSILGCENLSYGYRVIETKDSFDIANSFNLEGCYDCFACHTSFNLNFSENSRDCIDSYFLFDCRNCQNCFMSWNLRNQQYCIENIKYTKEEYFEKLKEYDLGSYNSLLKTQSRFEEITKNNTIHRENFNLKTSASTGNYLNNCDKCINVFAWENSQNCRNSLRGKDAKDCIDQVGCWKIELSGNNSCMTGGYQVKHSSWSDGRYSEYLDICFEVEYCFGCVGLRKKKYCILNKQYGKEEYESLRRKIIEDMERAGEYGEFLPYSMGLGDYNHCTNNIYLPDVKKDDIIAQGGYWSEEDLSSQDGVTSLALPDNISDTEETISSQALICPESKYRFNISPAEYQFHKRKNIALPRIHYDLRTIKKARKNAIFKSYRYTCTFCSKDINAYYPPEWNYKKIACEECYKQNIS